MLIYHLVDGHMVERNKFLSDFDTIQKGIERVEKALRKGKGDRDVPEK